MVAETPARYGTRTLAECEDAILHHMDCASSAYREIKERKLYKESHSRWEDYCQEKWGMSVDKVDKIISLECVTENLAEIPLTRGKISQSAASAVADLPKEQQRAVVKKVIDRGEKPTAKAVAKARQEVAPKPKLPEPERGTDAAPSGQEEAKVTDGRPSALHLAHVASQINANCREADSWTDAECREEIAKLLDKWLKKLRPASNGKFVAPTAEEVQAYLDEKGWSNVIDAELFVANYQRNGWKVGKAATPMKDWRATVVTWVKDRRDKPLSKSEQVAANNRRTFKEVTGQ